MKKSAHWENLSLTYEAFKSIIKAHYRICNKLESIALKYILREAAFRSSFGSKEKFFFFFFFISMQAGI